MRLLIACVMAGRGQEGGAPTRKLSEGYYVL